MICDTRMAAGALSTEAMISWPAASGITDDRIVAYSTSTEPAMLAMPPVITTNSSERDRRAR